MRVSVSPPHRHVQAGVAGIDAKQVRASFQERVMSAPWRQHGEARLLRSNSPDP